VLPASKARPNRSVDRVIGEHGWIDADDLAALTGERREPSVGRGVVSPEWLEATSSTVRSRVTAAGVLGLDLAELDDRQRHVVAMLEDVVIDSGRARLAGTRDPLEDHPFVAEALAGGASPPDPTGVDRAQLRELVRRSSLVERDGIYFHPTAIDIVTAAVAQLLRRNPDGFTVSQLREHLGVSRKYALPLANELDARGITRRRGDVRVAGPRLPGDAGSAPS
jgi:selenocysteine-specific elongation factor